MTDQQTLPERVRALRFAAITILLVYGLRLFAANKDEAFVLGMGAACGVIFLYDLAKQMERGR